jgi:copper resistance protein B
MKKILISAAIVASFGHMTFAQEAQADESTIFYGFQAEQLEYRYGEGGDQFINWDLDAFVLQKPVSDFWDAKLGFRHDYYEEETQRWFASLGLSGLAPQWIEVDADIYLSDYGQVSLSLDAEYELLVTNYLILTSSAELTAAFSSDETISSGSGINSAELGLRLSYDVIDRSFSPYIGITYERKFGQTADYAREEGEQRGVWHAVIGTKLMF